MKYNLVGINGNAFCIIGYVTRAMREEKCSEKEIYNYNKRATSGDYNNLLVESIKIIDELNSKYEDEDNE